jgi:hypothetical protein
MNGRWRRLVLGPLVALGAATLVPSTSAVAAEPVWRPGTPPLVTPWTDDVSPSNALPEYPRPQLTRGAWQNLNGVWEFAAASAGEPAPVGRALPERILVPYPVESALSGIQRHEDAMWYRRTVDVPAAWRSQRVMLNFGAVDYRATVWVNGVRVGAHSGGYDSWSLDITSALVRGGPQEILVRVEDPTDAGEQPVGKQRTDPGGIFYTPSSGIWQTVWMEPVAASHVERLDLTPNLRASTVRVNVRTTAPASAQRVRVSAYAGGRKVGEILGAPNTNLALPVPNPRLWSPDDPFLYDLKVTLLSGTRTLDSVGSYVGMRSIAVARGPDGRPRTVLNGRFLFQMGTLDQGFWPDGIYTAPTDEALRFDLEQQKRLGFNTVRKHIKVEPARWYYWTDRLGLMVWQDMPSTKIDWPENGGQPTTTARANFERELRRIVTQLRSVTSIVTWVPFNEGWGDYEVARIAGLVKGLDPSRLVDAESGVNCCLSEPDSGAGDLYDDHTYVGPGTPQPFDDRAVVDGEYGGLGLRVPGHEWSPGNGFAYETEPDAATLTRRYEELSARVRLAEQRCGLSAAIYTQPTDVENEINGLWTYDRQVLKPDPARVTAANRAVIDASGSVGTTPPPPVPPGTPGLTGVGYWPLDEGSGTVAQDAAGDHDATLVGGPQWTAGRSGSAVRFGGAGQYADTGASILDTTGSFSVSAWVRLDSAGGAFATAVSQDGDRASAFFLQYSGADGRFAFSTVSGRALAPTPPQVGRWYHLVGVRDAAAGQLRLYVDGALAGTRTQCLLDPGTGNTVIGRGRYDGQQVDFWRGAVDEVHVYDRALSDAEVAQLATAP